MKSLRHIVFAGGVMFVAVLAVLNAGAANTITFDNQSGKPALVKLVGPTAATVAVPNGTKQTTNAAAGHYTIKVRYGTPGGYAYSKGDEFDVKQTATSESAITITLHPVVNGNYGTRPISEAEFGTVNSSSQTVSRENLATVPKDEKAIVSSTHAENTRILVRVEWGESNESKMTFIYDHIVAPLLQNGFAPSLDIDFLDREIALQEASEKKLGGKNEFFMKWLLACKAQGVLFPKGVACPYGEDWEKRMLAPGGTPSITKADVLPDVPQLVIRIVAITGPRYQVQGGPVSGFVHSPVTADAITLVCKVAKEEKWFREFRPSFPDKPASLSQVIHSGWQQLETFLVAKTPKNLLEKDKASEFCKTEAEFIEAFKAAHEAKDIEALAKLVYWEGIPEPLKGLWKSQEAGNLGRPIKKIEVSKPDASQKAGEFNFPITASLIVVFEVQEKSGGATVTGTQTVMYPVGTKEGVFYILMPKLKK